MIERISSPPTRPTQDIVKSGLSTAKDLQSTTDAPPLRSFMVTVATLLVAASLAVWQVGDGTTARPKARDAGASSSSPTTVRVALPVRYATLMLYLVESQEQADAVYAGEAQAAQERAGAGIEDPDYELVVLNVTTPQGEQSVREILEAWANRGVHLVDLRAR